MSLAIRDISAFNRWRSGFNPLRGLTIQRAVSLLEEGERGALADLQWTFRYAEKRHPVLRGLKRRRLAAIAKLDWNIKIVAQDKLVTPELQALAKKQQALLRARYEAVDNLRAAIRFLALAEFRGYSHLEKVRLASDGNRFAAASLSEINHLEPVEQWFWVRDGIYGAWQYNGQASSGTYKGAPVTPSQFITREVEDPIDEIALLLFIRSGLADKDWDAFIEIYGIPHPTIIMPANVPTGKEAEYEAAAEAVADGQSGALPAGSDVKYPSEARGNQPFKERLEYLNEQLVLAGTSGKLTMLSDATGIGSGATDAHEAAFQALAEAEALEISELFQASLDKPALAEAFPGQPVLAYFEIAAKQETDPAAIIQEISGLASAGYQVSAEEVSEKTGYSVTVAATAPSNAAAPLAPAYSITAAPVVNRSLWRWLRAWFNREPAPAPESDSAKLRAAAEKALAAARAADLAPVAKRLAMIDALGDDAAFLAEMRRLQQELPALLAQVNANDQVAQTLTEAMAAELVNGLADEPIRNYNDGQSRDNLGRWVDANGGGLSPQRNLQRGQRALERALRQKTDVQKAMYRQGLGEIVFLYGTPGETAKQYAGGYGISHIAAKHPQDLKKLPAAIAKGRILPHDREADKRYVVHGNMLVVLRRQNKSRAYVVSGLEDARRIAQLGRGDQ